MAVTEQSYTGNGSTTNYSFTFPYLKSTDILVQVDQVTTTAWSLANATTIQFNTAPANGAKIKILRDTNVDNLTATFYAGSAIKSEDLNDNFTQNLYVTQEVGNRSFENTGTSTMIGNLQMGEDTSIVFEGATDNAHETTLTVTDPTADRTITLPNVTGTVVTTGDTGTVATGMLAADAVTSAKLADDACDSEHYTDGSIDTVHIGDLQVTTAKIAADAITSAKLADDACDSEHYTDGSIDTVHIAAGAITNNKMANNSVASGNIVNDTIVNADINSGAAIEFTKLEDLDSAKILVGNGSNKATEVTVSGDVTISNTGAVTIAAGAVENGMMANNSVASGNIVNGTIATTDIAADAIDSTLIADNAVGTEHIADAELTTLAGMQSGTASVLAGGTALAATLTEINTICDGKSVQTTISDSDAAYPTSGAVVDYVAAQIAPIGGLEVIADDESFPETQPAAGVVISIADAGGLVVNGSGVSTTGDTITSNATVTINNINSQFHSSTIAAGVGMQVSSTGSGQIYNYHKALLKEADLANLSNDINDFGNRYRVNAGEPGSDNDEGDLVYDTNADKMKVYDSSTSAWKEVTSTGDFKFLVPVDAGTTTAATWDGSDTSFDLKEATNSGSAASVTNVNQLTVVLNGVVQKPNAGSWSGSGEGFYLTDADTIRFATAPPSGSTCFIVQSGSAVSIPTPGDGTVTAAKIGAGAVIAAKIGTGAVEHAKLAADCVDGDNIGDDVINSEHIAAGAVDLEHMSSQSVDEDNLYIDNAGSNGQVLTKQSGGTGGLLWADASGGGAVGGGSDKIFMENGQTVTTNYTIGTEFGAACNALSAGPITINSGITVTIDSGDNWTIV